MKRPLVAALGILVLLLAAATTALALTVAQRWDTEVAYRMSHAPMSRAPMSRAPMHGAAVRTEAAFLAEMVAHHREAVAAAHELQRSLRPQMRAFGAAVVETQSAQIAQMRAWLNRWYPSSSPDFAYRPMMRDLAGLRGDVLDRTFLVDMIAHHMGAVMMSQQLLVRGLARHQPVADLAASIRDEQHAEILRMRRWLADWFGTGWGPGMGWHRGPRWT